ncbi:hypothetical protein CWM66_26585 [Kosakonia sp. H7A]|uniref:hypothetical protein n=1 Tax=Kosakonia sp. H7A TaxID=2054598 RepID=UPI000D159438|nr:hypothetical protein [Kosakonia sp. H7A]PTA87497.1 hypothetical protein CWM66_26585 [Kosakonia sp. H7A]
MTTTQTISREQLLFCLSEFEGAARDARAIEDDLYAQECEEVAAVIQEVLQYRHAMDSEPVAVTDERAAFETIMEKRFKDSIDRRPAKNGDGEYFAWDMQVAWIVWQARAAMQSFGNSEQLKAELATGDFRENVNSSTENFRENPETSTSEPVSQRYTLPPHIYRELVNQLRDTAVKYQGSQQLRAALCKTLCAVITPAVPEQQNRQQNIPEYIPVWGRSGKWAYLKDEDDD